MKLVNRAILLAFFITKGQLWAHCQVPCGIYDDALRIVQLREDFRTIQKAMDQIIHLKGKTSAQDMNQCIRWVHTKEEHAARIQETVSTYFLIQRIKAKTTAQGEEYDAYVQQATNLHQVMVAAMKCKQTVAINYVQEGLILLDAFVTLYFDDHGQEHLKAISGKL